MSMMIRLEEDRLFVGWIPVVVTINNTYVLWLIRLPVTPLHETESAAESLFLKTGTIFNKAQASCVTLIREQT